MDNKLHWIRDNSHLCVWPFSNYDYRMAQNKLKITVCCNLDIKMIDNEVDIDFIESMKHDITHEKKLPPACHLCTSVEKTGAQSERIKFFVGASDEFNLNFSQNYDKGEFQVGMKFSNKCNLACRSCNEYDSSLWSEKMRKSLPFIERNAQHDITENPKYWESMTSMIRQKYATTKNFMIHPIGGETMIQPGFQKLLSWMIDENLSENTEILLTTSLAANLEEWRDTFLKFKKVTFLSSIDSVHENYHYVRWPAKFSRIQRNLEEIAEVESRYPKKYQLFLTPVFSLNNIFYVPDFLDFWFEWSNTTGIPIQLQTTHINRPRPLMVESLRSQYVNHLIPVIESAINHAFFKQTNKPEIAIQLEYFKSMLNILKTMTQVPDKFFTDYLKFTADYDKRTNTNSRVLNSRLFDLLSPEDLEIYDNYYERVDINKPVYNINYDIEAFQHSRI